MHPKSLTWNDIAPNKDGKTYSVVKPENKAKKKPKYKNTVSVVDGVKYDSELEKYMHGLLNLHKIKYELKPSWELQGEFTYMGGKIKPIRLEPDFPILNEFGDLIAIVDTKGVKTAEWKIKIKMLKNLFNKERRSIPIFLPSNRGECHTTIIRIKELLNKE